MRVQCNASIGAGYKLLSLQNMNLNSVMTRLVRVPACNRFALLQWMRLGVLACRSGVFAPLLVLAMPVEASISSSSVLVAQSGGITAPLNIVGDTVSGVAICPSTSSSGCDFSTTDTRVRTHDIVEYSLSFNNLGTDSNTIVQADAPLGMVWDSLPGFCLAGSTVNNNFRPVAGGNAGVSVVSHLSCRLGTLLNQAQTLPIRALVLGIPNGTLLQPSFQIQSTESGTVTVAPPSAVTVTAAPRFDLAKLFTGSPSLVTRTDIFGNTVTGYQMNYWLRIAVDSTTGTIIGGAASTQGIVGAAPLDNVTLNITDLVNNTTVFPTGTALITGTCNTSFNGNYTGSPSALFNGANTTTIASSVATVSQTFACSQAAPGANIQITWSGINTGLNHIPIQAPNGVAIPGGLAYAALSPPINVIVPLASIPLGTVFTTRNCVTGFDPNGGTDAGVPISNFLANTEPGFAGAGNNCVNASAPNIPSGNVGKYLGRDVYADAQSVFVGTASSRSAGDGLVVDGATYSAQITLFNGGATDLNNTAVCDVWDNRKNRPKLVATGVAAGTYGTYRGVANASNAVLEFNSGYLTEPVPEVWTPKKVMAGWFAQHIRS